MMAPAGDQVYSCTSKGALPPPTAVHLLLQGLGRWEGAKAWAVSLCERILLEHLVPVRNGASPLQGLGGAGRELELLKGVTGATILKPLPITGVIPCRAWGRPGASWSC